MKDSSYRADIDGLRAIAILGVVAYHAGLPGIPGGFMGVDVFFVISGYLITQLLGRELETQGRLEVMAFYARRVRRLLPAFVTVVAATLVLGLFLLPPFGERSMLGKSAIAATALVANEFFRLRTGGYFDGPAESVPLLHLWSLSVEEQFYLVWPLVMIGTVWTCAARATAIRSGLLLSGVLLGLASFGLSLWLTGADPDRAFYFAGARAWELAIGAVLALRPVRPKPLSAALLGAAGVLLVGSGFVLVTPAVPFPGFSALLPTFGAAALIIAGASERQPAVTHVLSSAPMVRMGQLSYAWYLWHWPLLSIARTRRLGDADPAMDAALVAASLLLAWLTWRFIETPVRMGALAGRPHQVVAAGLVALLSTAVLGLGVWRFDDLVPRSGKDAIVMRYAQDRSPEQHQCAMAPRMWDGMLPRPGCRIGDPPAVAIWGDSHADAWSPLLAPLRDRGIGTVQLSMNACPPLLAVEPDVPGIRGMQNCPRYNQASIDYLASSADAGEIVGVVLAARWTAYSGQENLSQHDNWIGVSNRGDRTSDEALRSLGRGLDRTLVALEAAGIRVLVVLAGPEFRHSVPACLWLRPPAACGIATDVLEAHTAAAHGVVREVVGRHPKVRLLDPRERLCTLGNCPALHEGSATTWDDDHVSASVARAVGYAIRADLDWLSAGEPARAPGGAAAAPPQ